MELFSLDDPVYVVDLTPSTMERCRLELDGGAGVATPAPEPRPVREPPNRPLRAVALVFDWSADPVLLPIAPTRDLGLLESLARLLRMVLLTERSVAWLVTEAGDEALKRRYFAREFPRFIYEGIPASVRGRLPKVLWEAMGPRRRRRTPR